MAQRQLVEAVEQQRKPVGAGRDVSQRVAARSDRLIAQQLSCRAGDRQDVGLLVTFTGQQRVDALAQPLGATVR